MKLYCLSLSASTCCDYWNMDVLACGISEMDAKLNARKEFKNIFDIEADQIHVISSFDLADLKLNFVGVVSFNSGSK